MTLTRDALHLELLRNCNPGPLAESDALLWMVLLHTHEIRLHPGIVTDGDRGLVSFAALTQRHVASVIADLWAERKGDRDERSDYAYWYRLYNTQAPYETLADVPTSLLPRISELRGALAQAPGVAAVVPED
ncbi:MAG TPA: hypothetical protein VFA26_01055 [Gemmataceae bacterium]|nr:hypothetical protein [Gemmataceae bacterium]